MYPLGHMLQPADMPEPDKKPTLLERDVRWLLKRAALIGMLLGLVCHFLPPQYQAICGKIAQLCYAGGK